MDENVITLQVGGDGVEAEGRAGYICPLPVLCVFSFQVGGSSSGSLQGGGSRLTSGVLRLAGRIQAGRVG